MTSWKNSRRTIATHSGRFGIIVGQPAIFIAAHRRGIAAEKLAARTSANQARRQAWIAWRETDKGQP